MCDAEVETVKESEPSAGSVALKAARTTFILALCVSQLGRALSC